MAGSKPHAAYLQGAGIGMVLGGTIAGMVQWATLAIAAVALVMISVGYLIEKDVLLSETRSQTEQ